MTTPVDEILSWTEICEKHQYTDSNKPVLKNIILKLKPFMVKLSDDCNDDDYKKIRQVLCNQKNMTIKVKHTIIDFVKYCVEDNNDWDENWSEAKYKQHWLTFANCAQREKIFKAIDQLIDTHKKNISQKKNIVELEKTKEQLEMELDETKKELSLCTVEKQKFMKMVEKLKKDFDDEKQKNIQFYSDHKHLLEKFNNLQNEYNETKNMNKQFMDVIQNLSNANKTRRRLEVEDLSDSD
jgi:hypothetical protein